MTFGHSDCREAIMLSDITPGKKIRELLVYLCWRSFSAAGSNGTSSATSATFLFFSLGFSSAFLETFSAGAGAGAY